MATAALPGGLVQAMQINLLQTGPNLVTATLLSQVAGFNPWTSIGSPYLTATIAVAHSSSVPGGTYYTFTSPTGGGTSVYVLPVLIPVDLASAYLGRIWAQNTGGVGALYVGYQAFSNTGTPLSGNGGTYGYFIADGVTSSTWTPYSGVIGGSGSALYNFPSTTAYIQPLIVIQGSSTWQWSLTIPEFWEGFGFDTSSNAELLLGASKSLNFRQMVSSGVITLASFDSNGIHTLGLTNKPVAATIAPGATNQVLIPSGNMGNGLIWVNCFDGTNLHWCEITISGSTVVILRQDSNNLFVTSGGLTSQITLSAPSGALLASAGSTISSTQTINATGLALI